MSGESRPFGSLPHTPTIQIKDFSVAIPRSDVDDLQSLLRQALKRPPRKTYENTSSSRKLGISREWIVETTKYWEETFDWCVLPICTQ